MPSECAGHLHTPHGLLLDVYIFSINNMLMSSLLKLRLLKERLHVGEKRVAHQVGMVAVGKRARVPESKFMYSSSISTEVPTVHHRIP
jgi:hypothetical protein